MEKDPGAEMTEMIPCVRKDLDFFPVNQGGQKMVVIRDQLGIIPEDKVIDFSLFQVMALLDGTRTIRDLQMELMRQRGGVLVSSDEVMSFMANLDASYLLDSERYREAKGRMVAQFSSQKIRPPALCGRSYPDEPTQLKQMLDDILASRPPQTRLKGTLKAIVSPHIDLSAGARVYAGAYGMLRHVSPKRVILLGTGHHMADDLFCLTEKDFETPLGIVKNDSALVGRLIEAEPGIVAENDFEHRSEHSIEFQVLFLQHLLGTDSFTMLPILCGSLMMNLPSYNQNAYLEKAGPFLEELKRIIREGDEGTLIVAGVDFSHIGLKFGHQNPAEYMASRAEAHDRNLLSALTEADGDLFWEESIKVEDQYNVCGFSALACLLKILPVCKGKVLDYQMWHEAATQSAVSFSAVAFTGERQKKDPVDLIDDPGTL